MVNTYLKGTYNALYPDITRDEQGMKLPQLPQRLNEIGRRAIFLAAVLA